MCFAYQMGFFKVLAWSLAYKHFSIQLEWEIIKLLMTFLSFFFNNNWLYYFESFRTWECLYCLYCEFTFLLGMFNDFRSFQKNFSSNVRLYWKDSFTNGVGRLKLFSTISKIFLENRGFVWFYKHWFLFQLTYYNSHSIC